MIVCAMILSIFAPMATVYGASGLVKHGEYPLPGSSSIVGDFTLNGEQTFCIQHREFAAPDGTPYTESVYADVNVRKALYYGYNGPAQWSGFGSKQNGVIATSLVLSEIYNPGEAGDYDYIPIVAQYKAFLATQPAPPTRDVTFDKTSVSAYYDGVNDNQRTPNIKVKGTAGQNITFTIPSGIYVKNVTADTTLSGTVTLPVGTEFYLFADLGAASGTYSTGSVGESFIYQAILFKFPSSNYQDMAKGRVVTDPAGSTKLDAKWLDVGSLHLIKTQDYGDLLDGAKFNLKSTSFDGYDKEFTVTGGELKIDNIPVGTYMLTETEAPDGHSVVKPTYEVVIEKDKTTRQIVVNRLDPKGELTVNKTDVDSSAGIAGVEFTLSAADDIYSALTLEKIYSKGDVIEVKTSDDAGAVAFTGLPMGKYILKETKAADGYVPNDTEYPVEFRQVDFTTKIYTHQQDVQNKQTTTEISKQDATTGEELPGATLQVIDPETGDIIEEWTSTEQPHVIKGLSFGKEYTLHEDLAPLGYYVTQDVNFTVEAETKVVMKDEPTKTKISKQDAVNGKELPGAKLQIIDKETGDIIKEWTSTEEPEMIYGLEIDKEYILHEDLAPLGYYVTEDIEFTVSDDPEKIKTVTMKDEPSKVEVSKQDFTTGKELPGATMQIIDPVTGKVVEEWVSKPTPHMIYGLAIGKEYVLKETIAPQGYELAEEIRFTVTEDPNETTRVVMKDKLKVGRIVVDNNHGFGPTGIVKTGDTSNDYLVWGILIAALLAMGISAIAAKKREEKEIEE